MQIKTNPSAGKPKYSKRNGPVWWYMLLVMLSGSVIFVQPAGSQALTGFSKQGATFLGINPYARQVALGDAFTGLGDDLSTLRYNVGALGGLPNAMMAFHFHNWIDDTQQGAIGGALPTKYGTLGLDLHYFNEGKLSEIDDAFSPTGRQFDNNDVAVTLGYGRFFALMDSGLSVGTGFRYVRQNLADEIAWAVGADLGIMLYSRYFSLGMTVQNLGLTKLKFFRQQETLPETYRGGIGVRVPMGKYVYSKLATDIAFIRGQKLRYYSGAEMVFANLFAIRGGYKFHAWEVSRWSLGFGLFIPMEWLAGSETRLDYAYSPLEAFEASVHRFSLLFSFGSLQRRHTAQLYDERRLTRLVYEEKRMEEMNEKLRQELEAAEQARKAAEEARRAAEEAERRTRELEAEMRNRLNQILEIAKTSQGKIEVVPKTETEIQVTLRINFDFDSAVIRPEEYPTMQQVAKILNTYPESRVWISGHTDNVGTEDYNIRLSERRVRSVMAFLATRETVTNARFYMPVGYGELRPIAGNETETDRFRNRRVDFTLYTQGTQPVMPEGSAILDVITVGDSTVQIIGNGKLTFTHRTLTNPDRIVMDFQNVFLLSDMQEFLLNRGPFTTARIAFHPQERYTRVVLDLRYPIRYSTQTIENYIKLKVVK
ncbi:PorV/PorQ family protein [candidate division KSB1 bacterium]|nr:PorV/PorQ family protein [candidate division KSB1 bacterium]